MNRPIRRHGSHSVARPHTPPALPDVELQITRGRARNSVRTVTGLAYLIGAAEDNDLVLADDQFPESHSYLLRSPLGLMLCWLGEGPEITVDGQPVLSSALVPDGSRLRTGPYEFRVRVQWNASPTPAAHPAFASQNEAGDDGAAYGSIPSTLTFRPQIS